jgi:hypothetical protein
MRLLLAFVLLASGCIAGGLHVAVGPTIDERARVGVEVRAGCSFGIAQPDHAWVEELDVGGGARPDTGASGVVRGLLEYVDVPEDGKLMISGGIGGSLRGVFGDPDGLMGGGLIDVSVLEIIDDHTSSSGGEDSWFQITDRSVRALGVQLGAELLADGNGASHGLFSMAFELRWLALQVWE